MSEAVPPEVPAEAVLDGVGRTAVLAPGPERDDHGRGVVFRPEV